MSTALRKIDKFTPSQNPYWFNTGDVLAGTSDTTHVRVMWVSRKGGRTVVTQGTYMLFPFGHLAVFPDRAAGAEAIIGAADTRYGGEWEYRWDGQRFQENPTAPVKAPDELAVIRENLDRILNDLPGALNERAAWIGPFYKTEVDR
ncbi:hypothetical protein ACT17_15170 [Mycolicibacterium conceptionense]|uniref:Uncharacterized protein n=1 Tax=Mycolicibacterium conceptionense TaxID=451644 RepID=A0A0J8U880_9MYCO|nr:hypothetical protein [Mycolicibacterium conceptionense]KMV17621.1 hypothetical protein ACT17_15170 [Mycolicibacterium conceptionense]